MRWLPSASWGAPGDPIITDVILKEINNLE